MLYLPHEAERRLSLQHPREQIWEALFDPAVVGECVPGLRSFAAQSADRYDVELGLRVGIVSGSYKGTVEVIEKTAPTSCRVVIQGTGVRTNLKGEGSVALSEENGATTVAFEGDVQVTGTLARVGQRFMSSVAKTQFDQFFQCLRTKTEPAQHC